MAEMFAKQLGGTGGALAPGPNGPLELGPDIEGMPHLAMPLQGSTLTSGFGYRPDPVLHVMTHPGLDLSAPMGTQVTAASPGTVIHAGPGGNYGNLVMIRHDNGFETRYAHLSAVTVQKGDRVVAGQEVGKVGSTGYSVGPHLHFEVRHDDKAIDPAPLLPLNRSSSRTNR
jgi:murein DD-endopeptidase MepM/ murein hydrolase activator NlpD